MTTRPAPSNQPGARTSSGSGREAADRRLGRALLAIVAAWVLIGVYVVHSQLPSSTLELPGQEVARPSLRMVTPQGWAFFTKSPREPQLIAWVPATGDGWTAAMFAPHSEPRNAFGLNRRSRAQPVELGLLTSIVPAERWRDCELGDIPACLAEAGATTVDNPTPRPLLCGQVGVSSQVPLPWAWADAADRTSMPATVVRLEVRC